MGLLDLFKKKAAGGGSQDVSWSLSRKIKKAHNRFTQADERMGALYGLQEDGSEPAIKALVKRLTFYVEPLTTDEREKEYVKSVLLERGQQVVPHLVESIRTSNSIQWQLALYHDLAAEEEVLATLLGIIEGYDTEYEKNPQRKIQIIDALGSWRSDRVASVLLRFLEDVDEEVRYQTVQSLLRQDPEVVRDRLLTVALQDQSNRILDLVIEGFVAGGIPIKGFPARKQFEDLLGPDMSVDKQGVIKKRPPRSP